MTEENGYLDGQLLVATPNVTGSGFKQSVVLMCAHSHEGAMGIIINHMLDNLTYKDLFEQLSIDIGQTNPHAPIYYGGPVEVNRGFVIYEYQDEEPEDAIITVGNIAISSSMEILKAIAEGKGPQSYRIALGYAGWAPGQLEAEVESNSWISVPLSSELVFGTNDAQKWHQAAKMQGVDLSKLSTVAGHA